MSEEKGGSMVLFLLLAGIALWVMFAGPKEPYVSPVKSDHLIDEAASVLDDFVEDPRLEDTQPMPTLGPPEILIFASNTCPPCKQWIECEMPKFMMSGWKVGIIYDHPFPRMPTFHLITDGGLVEHVGYLTLEQAKGLLK